MPKPSEVATAVKLVAIAVAGGVLCAGVGACHRHGPAGAGRIDTAAQVQPTQPKPPTAPAAPQESPYRSMTKIFEEFARVVETHQAQPDTGFQRCKDFAAAKIPELKTLATQAKQIESGPRAADYLQEIMAANEKIQQTAEKITKIAHERYQSKGTDLLLLLSDLALARL